MKQKKQKKKKNKKRNQRRKVGNCYFCGKFTSEMDYIVFGEDDWHLGWCHKDGCSDALI